MKHARSLLQLQPRKDENVYNRYGMWTVFLLIFLTIICGIGAWLVFLWSVKSCQYDDPERPKYRMLEDGDERKK